MAFTYGFYNSQNGDRKYSAEEFGSIFDGIIVDGIYESYKQAMVVTPSEYANSVTVSPGRGWFKHTWCNVDTNTVVEGPAPELMQNSNRLDALVIDINKTERTNSLLWVKGEPLINGTKHTCPTPVLIDTAEHDQHPLCYVIRYGTVTAISGDDIINQIGIHPKTPFIKPVTDILPAETILSNWNSWFETWSTEKQAEVIAWMASREQEFDIWFAGVRDQLDEDAAGHLQNEIESLTIRNVGTASSESAAYSAIGFQSIPSSFIELPGTAYYFNSVEILPARQQTVRFSNISPNRSISVYTSNPNINYDEMYFEFNQLCIKYTNPSFTDILSFTVKVYVR